ncbi:MAG: dihydrodipicolinate reductase [Acidobacteriota bacterium]
MHVFIAGSGKLATELLEQIQPDARFTVSAWSGDSHAMTPALVVHAGSGRELPAITAFCQRTGSVLMELSTGSSLEGQRCDFPVVLCPNTNILMLKFMHMLERSGALFHGSEIRLTESHQAGKTSTPGTAVSMAEALGVTVSDLVSVRDPAEQQTQLRIPPAHLARHAFHRIEIQDGACQITMETRVYGDAPYAQGVRHIIQAVLSHRLEARPYAITEFIENGWL